MDIRTSRETEQNGNDASSPTAGSQNRPLHFRFLA
jgi:hypothetical protein